MTQCILGITIFSEKHHAPILQIAECRTCSHRKKVEKAKRLCA